MAVRRMLCGQRSRRGALFASSNRDSSHVIDLAWFVFILVGEKCGSMMILQANELIP